MPDADTPATPATPARDILAGLLERFTQVVRLVRPVGAPAPAYVRCAGCRKGGRDDQGVPDPDQFMNKLGMSKDIVGNAATVPGQTDAAEVKLIDAAPVWCEDCRAWYHAIRCYSMHRHD